jgi:hypothetical protein
VRPPGIDKSPDRDRRASSKLKSRPTLVDTDFSLLLLTFFKQTRLVRTPNQKITDRNSIKYFDGIIGKSVEFLNCRPSPPRISQLHSNSIVRFPTYARWWSGGGMRGGIAAIILPRAMLVILLDTRPREWMRAKKTIACDNALRLSSPLTTVNITTTRRQCGSVRGLWMN